MKKTPILKTKDWVLTERQEEVKCLIEVSLQANPTLTTYRALIETTGAAQYEIDRVFECTPLLKAEFQLRRKGLANTAVDNIHTIVNDPNHPQNFAASKFIVQTFKTDLDEELESKVQVQAEFDAQDGIISPVKITFTKTQ